MKTLVFTSIALLSLSANTFAGICGVEATRIESNYSEYNGRSVPMALNTISSADRVLQISLAIREATTKAPVPEGYGNVVLEQANQLEREIQYKLDENLALRRKLVDTNFEMLGCLNRSNNTNCHDSAMELINYDTNKLTEANSIHHSGMDLKNDFAALGEKLNKLSRSGASAQMSDFQMTIEKAQNLFSLRNSYLNQVDADAKVRSNLSQSLNNCLNSSN
ncbi:hypothetical protein [Peredibacter starrii]|uniref:Uncharacterized protein n=1 Tax=Peredibacter starrii TaxID=28202 RepID=A0AAX4HTC4_9BACT|nr:hypothetical protein [Peredibacter starrii]WPU66643.1 hypothetical protein SOO65_07785 [Peredibacter starrii]